MKADGAPARATAKAALHRWSIAALAVVLGSVNAVVDSILHPEIPFFDSEHLIVGGVTIAVYATFTYVLSRYRRRLQGATDTIGRLEAMLPICASCKRIRRPGADAADMRSWQQIESYLLERTTTEFSHGMCPDCIAVFYPEYVGQPAKRGPQGS